MITKTPIIFEQSRTGKTGVKIPTCDVTKSEFQNYISSSFIRENKANLPEVSEPEVVRHYTNLSVKNHHVDRDLYPLGSCTMKYNPKINDVIASLPGFANIHPDQPLESVQGALQLIWELEQMLIEITGMSRVTLQPTAGAQGEFVGILIMKKFHEINGNLNKEYILIPETAHGTNPASVIFGGYKTKQIKSDERGRVDIEDLKSKLDKNVAGMMLTQPNTLGLFEDNIEEITSLVHSFGGLMYMDGANLNALVGLTRPADMGFDITHINLHKTFSTPHGGGGPGAGPIAVTEKLAEYLPVPMIKRNNNQFSWDYDMPKSVGQIHSYYGNFSILVRAWAYIKTMGESGLREMTEMAIVNANYIKAKLNDNYIIPFSEGTLHEFVISGIKQKEKGAKTLDIAKALLDKGFHAPTIYFPINVPKSMMIEPTETESKETLDRFIDAMIDIDDKITLNPNEILNAPFNTPVSRLDETKANRNPDLRWKNEV